MHFKTFICRQRLNNYIICKLIKWICINILRCEENEQYSYFYDKVLHTFIIKCDKYYECTVVFERQ